MIPIKKLLLLLVVFSLVACENSSSASGDQSASRSSARQDSGSAGQALVELEKDMEGIAVRKPWTGDFDTMHENRVVRVLTVYGLGRYYLDDGQEKGAAYEMFKMFESFLNEKFKKKHIRIHVVFLPVARDQLIPALLAGRGDIVAAGLTITPERSLTIDFSDPVSKAISEILVTGPSAPRLDSLEDLAGQEIPVRASSSYHASLVALNERFRKQGLEEIELVEMPEHLEDEDILEMVSAGLLHWAVVDDYKAVIWSSVFEKLTPREDLVLRSGGRIAYAMRKDSPQLAALLNEFVGTHKQGTLHGNILINRYLKDIDWTKNALDTDDYARFEDVAEIFQKYGNQYGIDYLMVAAQGYQESRLDQSARSSAGAIGIMQLLPTTAADANVGIPDISNKEPNIHAGVKYLRFIRDRYFSVPEIDTFNQNMFAFAAYNAGPARVRKLREKAAQQGYDPHVWFDNVEVIAAKDIGRETVEYVANILKYYVAYSLSTRQQLNRAQARKDAGIKP